jgi:secondary thiamine-phosphate synthase enzyme
MTSPEGEKPGHVRLVTRHLEVSTQGNSRLLDITGRVEELLRQTGLSEGQVLIFAPGATAGITTIEFEPGLQHDFPEMLERIAPADIPYQHDGTWGDGNGHGHVRASLIGASLTVPFEKQRLLLGTWQQIVIVDCDNRPRKRTIAVQFFGV